MDELAMFTAASAPAARAVTAPLPNLSSDDEIAGALNTWRELDVTSLRLTLQEQALEIASNKEAAAIRRKKLMQETKALLKQLPEAERGAQVGRIVKAFREEVDQLTMQCKFCEGAFVPLCKTLREAPDPATYMEESISVREHSDAVRKERDEAVAELATLEEEVAGVKDQGGTIRRLEAKVRQYEQEQQGLTEKEVASARRELDLRHEQALTSAEARERELRKQLEAAEERIAQLHKSHDDSQSDKFDMASRLEERSVARSAEEEMLRDGLRRAEARAEGLEREKHAWKRQRQSDTAATAAATGGGGGAGGSGGDSAEVSAMRLMVTAKEGELERQADSLAAARLQLARAAEESAALQQASAAATTAAAQREAALCEEMAALPRRAHFERLRRELRELRSVQFSVLGEEWGSDDKGEGGAGAEQRADLSAEKLLARKAAVLEGRCASLHGELRVAKAEAEAAKAEAAGAEEQRALVKRLEEELLAAQHSTAAGGGGAAAARKSGAELLSAQPASAGSTGHGQGVGGGGGSGTLAVVTGQRDRFKAKVFGLEEQLQSARNRLGSSQAKVSGLQKENVELCGKIRYVQQYGASSAAEGGSESKYASEYEEGLNPFAKFKSSERSKSYRQLSAPEKVAMNGFSTILANRRARAWLMLYILALHFLLWLLMQRIASYAVISVAVPEAAARAQHTKLVDLDGDGKVTADEFKQAAIGLETWGQKLGLDVCALLSSSRSRRDDRFG